MEKTKEKNSFLFNLLLITVFFNIWFPKAGIKLAGIPLTVGNVFLAITFICWLLKKLKNKIIRIHKISYLVGILMIYSIVRYIVLENILENI